MSSRARTLANFGDGIATADIGDGQVTDAKIDGMSSSKLSGALPAIDGSALTGVGGGITRAEMWILTTNKTSAGSLTANLAQESGDGYGGINAGMSESSGIFTFPETGYWLVRYTAVFEEGSGGDDQARPGILFSSDNFSSESYATRGFVGLTDPPNEFAQTENIEFIFDITDTTNQKIKFDVGEMNSGNRLLGSTNQKLTGFTFIRLGDT